jgi:hypothetical protein
MLRTRVAAGLLTFVLPLAFLSAGEAARPAQEKDFRFPEGRVAGGSLAYRNGLPVLVVEGSPEQMGTAAGTLALKPSPQTLEYTRCLLRERNAERLYDLFVKGGNGMFGHFPPAYRAEIDALARSAGVSRDDVIVGNTFFDLKKVFACSAVLVEPGRSATGGPLLGRNLDYPSLGYIHKHSLVTVYRPTGKHAFATVGFPGLVGCLSGMNDAGLCVAILEVFQVKDGVTGFDPEGLPYALCYRKILEDCTTIDQAQKCLEGLRRTTTTNLVVADRDGVAVLEVTPARVARRAAGGGACACTNHFCTPDLRPADVVDVSRTLGRFGTLNAGLKGEAKLTPDDLRKRLDAVNLGELTLQTMVFEPRTLRLHLAVGETPASAQPFRTVDLGPLLRGEEGK